MSKKLNLDSDEIIVLIKSPNPAEIDNINKVSFFKPRLPSIINLFQTGNTVMTWTKNKKGVSIKTKKIKSPAPEVYKELSGPLPTSYSEYNEE